MIYKCNKCGFMDVNIGMQAHLIKHPECLDGKKMVTYNEQGKIIDYGNLSDFTTTMTEAQYTKELEKLHEDSLKKEEPKPKDIITKKGDGKKYNQNGFEVKV